MQLLTSKTIKNFVVRVLSAILLLALAWLWVMLSATPAFAQATAINYTNINLENRDFSNADLVGGVFVAAEMRGTNFQGADLTNAILTKRMFEKSKSVKIMQVV
jgi:uncharacterized protein YjbI with pentapeptide repeats